MSYDLETRKRFLDLRTRGYSYERIAKELNIAKRTLLFWGMEMQSQLNTLRSVHLDAVRDESGAQTEQRISLLGQQLKKLLDELAKRDLSRIHETNLFHLILRYSVALRKEDQLLTLPLDFHPDDPLLDHPDRTMDTKIAPELRQNAPDLPSANPKLVPDLIGDPKSKIQNWPPVSRRHSYQSYHSH